MPSTTSTILPKMSKVKCQMSKNVKMSKVFMLFGPHARKVHSNRLCGWDQGSQWVTVQVTSVAFVKVSYVQAYCSAFNAWVQQSARGGLNLVVHGFALALVPVSLWCDGASILRPAALVLPRAQGFRRRSGDVPSPHIDHAEVVWMVVVWQGRSGPVMLLPERRHHGVVTNRIGWPGPCTDGVPGGGGGDPMVRSNFSPTRAETVEGKKKLWGIIS